MLYYHSVEMGSPDVQLILIVMPLVGSLLYMKFLALAKLWNLITLVNSQSLDIIRKINYQTLLMTITSDLKSNQNCIIMIPDNRRMQNCTHSFQCPVSTTIVFCMVLPDPRASSFPLPHHRCSSVSLDSGPPSQCPSPSLMGCGQFFSVRSRPSATVLS